MTLITPQDQEGTTSKLYDTMPNVSGLPDDDCSLNEVDLCSISIETILSDDHNSDFEVESINDNEQSALGITILNEDEPHYIESSGIEPETESNLSTYTRKFDANQYKSGVAVTPLYAGAPLTVLEAVAQHLLSSWH